VAHVASGEVLNDVLGQIRSLRREGKPPTAHIEFLLRQIDHAKRIGIGNEDGEDILERLLHPRRDVRLRAWLRMNRDTLIALSALPYPESERREQEILDGLDRGADRRLSDVIYSIGALTEEKPTSDMLFDAAEIVIALELYRQDRDGYPESLDSLAPDYFPAVPRDVRTEEPFVYQRVSNDYRFYSIGANGIDNGGFDPEKRAAKVDDIVFHWPPV
jgi:hypothetical protein